MRVSTEKSKIMTNSTNNINAAISMNGQRLEEVASFKYLGVAQRKDGTCSAEVGIGIASATAAMARLNQQDLAVQHNQLCRQVQALQVSRHLHPSEILWTTQIIVSGLCSLDLSPDLTPSFQLYICLQICSKGASFSRPNSLLFLTL